MHAVSLLAARLFETHDRSRFELTAFAFGADTRDGLRTRVEAAFDRFLPVDGLSDREVAMLARRLEIDIAIDLGGYTRDCRSGIFALRAAPIQVSYLGYLGTMGAEIMDYLIADPVLVPPDSRQHYSEKIAYLTSYQVNDSSRPLPDRAPTRDELGLPPRGFVFCSFNNSYKINPETFDSWMRILTAVPDSALFLLGGPTAVERNLRREAAARGVAPERLVFGGSLPLDRYLARFRAADLFLDTLPYNAGTTASDALWAGLPVLTVPGQAFAARMAASILTAAGLPELIAASRADYERQAIALAADPRRLAEMKQRLADNRRCCALFDTTAFTRDIEALYQQMYERHHAGLRPEHLNPPPA
jgi:predicted O-linked N-acetylglucosamine transferase (SPINDLY family)